MTYKYRVYTIDGHIEFASSETAEAYKLEHDLPHPIESVPLHAPPGPEAYVAQLERDLEFGKQLIAEFLKDNRLLPVSISVQDSLALLHKFQGVEALARLGDIKGVYAIMQGIEVDALFTQERKTRYLLLLTTYLGIS